jgi:competence ComEA-like helix-hairpin-helix protein
MWVGIGVVAACFWLLLLVQLDSRSQSTQMIDSAAPPPAERGLSQDAEADTLSRALAEDSEKSEGCDKQKPKARTGRSGDCIDVNSADSAALVSIKGIGPVLAGRIIAYRSAQGKFKKANDLVNVKGIGPAKLKKMRPYICF